MLPPGAREPAFADEAVRVTRLLEQLLPDEPEVSGLLALLLLQHSRRAARRDGDGTPRTLDEQDRSRHRADTLAADAARALRTR